MKWILIVAFISSHFSTGNANYTVEHYHRGIAMQEFNDLPACQFASVEAQKLAPYIRVVCVPKETPHD